MMKQLENSKEEKESSSSLRKRLTTLRHSRLFPVLLCLPYLIGAVWHCLHPFVSVFTGQPYPRRLYVDENSADPFTFRIHNAKFKPYNDQLLLLAKKKPQSVPSSLCEALETVLVAVDDNLAFTQNRGNLVCESIHGAVQVLQITPAAGPVTIRSEAIVLVLPSADDWFTSPIHASFLSFFMQLASPQFTWLAKTVLVVAPTVRPGQTLSTTEAVNVFLDAYLGPSTDTEHKDTRELVGSAPTLPLGLTRGAILRQLIVWDQVLLTENTLTASAIKTPLIRILPQGPRGILPNMDLVSVIRTALQRALGGNVNLEIHPYQEKSKQMGDFLNRACHGFTGKDCPADKLAAILNFFWFQHAMRGHDKSSSSSSSPIVPCHGSALERGIDALTVQFVANRPLRGGFNSDVQIRNVVSKLPSAMEISLRALSNLHERLHHSTSLYLLLDNDHFVKHEEYLVPNLLLLIPLLIRAVTLVLVDLPEDSLDWTAVGSVVEYTVLSVVGISYGLALVEWIDAHSWWIFADDGLRANHAIVGAAYLILSWQFVAATKRTTWSSRARQSLQLFSCLWGLYTHVAIAFGHVSLAFPSALFWTPILAFPSYNQLRSDRTSVLVKLRRGLVQTLAAIVFLATLPFVGLVPHLFPSYTPYVCYAYLPLHLMCSHLWLS